MAKCNQMTLLPFKGLSFLFTTESYMLHSLLYHFNRISVCLSPRRFGAATYSFTVYAECRYPGHAYN